MMASDSGSTMMIEKEFPKTEKTKTNYDVIIIGAGPAGYTAGIYCARARHETLILSGLLPGGQLVNTTEVENYPGFEHGIMGPDLMITMRKQTERMGAKIIDDEVIDVDFRHRPFKILTASEEFECKAVIIATGASPRKLGIAGEQVFGGKGVSYCATCDGPFFRNQEIVVVGGGDSAVEEATFLTKFGSKIHLIHRKDQLRASKVMQERALNNPKIQMHWNSTVSDITGENRVQEVILTNTKTNQKSTLPAGAVFVAIGHEPNTKIFVNRVELDEQGYIKLKDHTKTNIPGVFAAGDVHDHRYRQAITAAGFGCMAAIDVDRYLTENKS
ncbi:MAG: thioredoxin-disulfide reductase [Nitrosopumilaceae archaeon]|nr:thioredoxin-disulfide reductase [Nitrosopumilaceae archaeon]